jgi:hypothetical protein
MSDFNYKKYSLEQLTNWVHDALDTASPHEIYSTIRNVVQEQHNYHKENAQKCFGLLELLSGHRPVDFGNKWNEWQETSYSEEVKDKVKKWILPVEETKISETDEIEYFITFPDDLLEAADLKEGDPVEWVDNGDGTWMIRKVKKFFGHDDC